MSEAGPERPYALGSSLWDLIEHRAAATPALVLAADSIGLCITFGGYRPRLPGTAPRSAAPDVPSGARGVVLPPPLRACPPPPARTPAAPPPALRQGRPRP